MDNKKFLETLSQRLDISLPSVGTMVTALSAGIADVASGLDSVVVPGFGTFEPKLREERVALHPASGQRLLVPPRIYLSFKQSPVLKAKLNGK